MKNNRPTPKEEKNAMEAICQLMDKTVESTFMEREIEESDEEGYPLIIDTYNFGDLEAWIGDGKVVQLGPVSGRYPTMDDEPEALPAEELEEKAVEVILRTIPSFEGLKPYMHHISANDHQKMFFFRWEDLSEPLSGLNLPPFIQVGLSRSGELLSYADTISVVLDELAERIGKKRQEEDDFEDSMGSIAGGLASGLDSRKK